MNIIAHIHTDFPHKFGVPRQSGLVDTLKGRVVFTPAYRDPDALRGLDAFSHLWLLWQFSETVRQGWSPTVRPPRLGGNRRMGVFATRSPFRPNPIGLSCVRLERVESRSAQGPVLHVCGVDMVDGTPLYDIKPYLPYTDSHPDAADGFAGGVFEQSVTVNCPPALLSVVPATRQRALLSVLAQDPRPSYQHDPERVYGFTFAGLEIKFTVSGDQLTVRRIDPISGGI